MRGVSILQILFLLLILYSVLVFLFSVAKIHDPREPAKKSEKDSPVQRRDSNIKTKTEPAKGDDDSPAQRRDNNSKKEKALGGWHDEPEFSSRISDLVELKNEGQLKPYSCPCCGWHGDVFAPHNKKPNRKCPVCKSFERHRRACAVLGAGTPRHAASWYTPHPERADSGMPFRLVHFGPQKVLEDALQLIRGVDHVSLDFLVEEYQSLYSKHVLHADVTNIPLPTKFADGILIFHVLEHIAELDKALQELKRILYKTSDQESGWMLVEVPCRHGLGQHKDCRGNMTKDERIACAGQWDHVWIFDCHLFETTLRDNGFDCYIVDGSQTADFGRAAPIMESCHCTDPKTIPPLYACTVAKTT